jgi:hypothetical protein
MAVITDSNQSLDLTGFPPTLKHQIEHYQSLGVRFAEEDHDDYYVVIAWNFQSSGEGSKRPRPICWKGCVEPQNGYALCIEYLKDHRPEWDH